VYTEFISQLQPTVFDYCKNVKQDLNNKCKIPETIMEYLMCHSSKWCKPNLSSTITNTKRDAEGKTDK
jgi:hypothetical protein